MDNYVLEISKKDFLGMLSKYFTLKYNKIIQVKEKHNVVKIDSGRDTKVNVEIYYEETKEILGYPATKTTMLSKEEIQEILNELLNQEDYYVDSFIFRTRTEYKGGGSLYEPSYEVGIFEGAKIKVKEKQKTLQKK